MDFLRFDHLAKAVNPLLIIFGFVSGLILNPIIHYFNFKEAVASEMLQIRVQMASDFVKKDEMSDQVKEINSELKILRTDVKKLLSRRSD